MLEIVKFNKIKVTQEPIGQYCGLLSYSVLLIFSESAE